MIYVAARYGEEASLVRFAGDDDAEILRPTERTVGRVADCVRRALDLPTTPEPHDSLLALWWDRVLQKLAARNHPSFGENKLDVDEVASVIAAARPRSWGDERWTVIANEGSLQVSGALAAWLDDGMFARLLLAELVDPDVAIPAAKRACTAQAWTALLKHFAAAALGESTAEHQDAF